MRFARSILDRLEEAKGQLTSAAMAFTNRNFLKRAMAVGHVVGRSDGTLDNSEKEGLVKLVQNHPTLRNYSEDDIRNAFNEIDGLYSVTTAMGNRSALELIAETTDRAEAKALMEFGAVISTLDGTVDESEIVTLGKVAAALNEDLDSYKDLLEV